MYSIYSYLLRDRKDISLGETKKGVSKVAQQDELGYYGKTCFENPKQLNSTTLQKYGYQVSKKNTVFVVITIIILLSII